MIVNNKTQETVVVVDNQTGEVIDSTTSVHEMKINRKVTRENFIMVYLEDLSGFLNIDNGTQIRLLSLIWKEVNYNNPEVNEGNTIAILKDVKERWCSELNCAMRTVENSLAALVKKELLIQVCKGKYKLNPKYFFKGSSADRQKVLNLQATYEFEPDKDFDDNPNN